MRQKLNKNKKNSSKLSKTYKTYVQEIVYTTNVCKRGSNTEQKSKGIEISMSITLKFFLEF